MIVLDTHAWIWWLTKPDKLGKKAARALDKAEKIGIPAICVWELAMKVRARKLKFDRPLETWVQTALTEDARLELLHLQPRISIEAVQLSWNHSDPADRFIVATARAHDALLVTSDEEIARSGLVRCVWD